MPSQKNILITGASGFVGKHLVELGLKQGHALFALVRKTSDTAHLKGVRLLYGDVTDYDGLVSAFVTLKKEGVRLDYIIHAAALTKSISKNEMRRVNYIGTFNLYTALERIDYLPEKIIFVSSLAACGPGKLNSTIYKNQVQPISTYGKSKLEAEQFILHSTSIPTVIIRPTAVYGPGEKDLFSVFKLVNKGIHPVLGSHIQQLTFIYVKDLAAMIYAAIENAPAHKIYFATDGNIYDKYALPKAIADALKKKSTTLHLPLVLVNVAARISHYLSVLTKKPQALNPEKYEELIAESWVCDMDNTFKELKYLPVYDLKSGVAETSQWYKQNKWI